MGLRTEDGFSSKTPEVEDLPVSRPFSEIETDTPEIAHNLDRARENLMAYILKRNQDVDQEMLGKAIDFTIRAHKNQFRRSGMPYAEHPFEVAKLLTDLQMDGKTIIAGLLHDVVEDTKYSIDEIKEKFGEEVAFLVESVTKISALQVKTRVEQQAETFRKMLVSMAKDIRVIMIKFADRLHNMRTLNYMKEERKKAIAQETLEVFAPLAHRFGLAKIKWELEDLSFKYLNQESYKTLVQKVVETRREREVYTREIVGPIKKMLEEQKIPGKVFGRPKHLYSIYRKMKSRKCQFEDLYDLYGLRIIVKTLPECYAVLGYVHNFWQPLQSRFKDYIATPKSNMYQSLHTTVIGPQGKSVEIQIRTEEMDLTAEQGIAAHWAYKEGKKPNPESGENKWLKQFLEWQKDLTDSTEFMDFFRGDLAPNEIFVFTPNGDLVQLPKGATALDFAFALHSEVGVKTIGARVDGNLVPLHKVLSTGSRVEILKSPSQHPSRDWLSIVITSKAKSAIRRWLRNEEATHFQQLGKELVEREFRLARISKQNYPDKQLLEEKFNVSDMEGLCEKVGRGEVTIGSLSGFIENELLDRPKKSGGMLDMVRLKKPSPRAGDSVLVSGLSNMLVRYATCCHPVPGDKIIGYVTRGRGVSVHRSDCPEGMLLMKDVERMIPVQWRSESNQVFYAFMEIQGKDRPELLKEITDCFSQMKINIVRASIITLRDQVRNRFKIEVSDLSQLKNLINSLRRIKGINSVTRKQLHSLE